MPLLGVRAAYWTGVAVALLWAPLRGPAISPLRAYGALSDLLFAAFARWDAVWWVHVADHGYDSKQITAFFPLYPLAVRALSHLFGSTIVAGTLLSIVAGSVGVAAVHRIGRMFLSDDEASSAVLLIALYPLAFVFTAVYSEGLFLALSAWAFLAAARRQAALAGTLGGLAVATRLAGLALLPALVILLWPRSAGWRGRLKLGPLILMPLALAIYALFLRHRFGDALAFVHAEGVFWHRHTPTLGPVGGLWDAVSSGYHGAIELARHLPRGSGYPAGFAPHDQWAMWNVIQLLVLAAALGLTVIAWRRLGPAFGVYSAGVIAIILSSPADFVPLAGSPRFLLTDFPLFLALASVLRARPNARLAIYFFLAAIGAIAAVAFSRGVWIA